jgi:hypothetical protein
MTALRRRNGRPIEPIVSYPCHPNRYPMRVRSRVHQAHEVYLPRVCAHGPRTRYAQASTGANRILRSSSQAARRRRCGACLAVPRSHSTTGRHSNHSSCSARIFPGDGGEGEPAVEVPTGAERGVRRVRGLEAHTRVLSAVSQPISHLPSEQICRRAQCADDDAM